MISTSAEKAALAMFRASLIDAEDPNELLKPYGVQVEPPVIQENSTASMIATFQSGERRKFAALASFGSDFRFHLFHGLLKHLNPDPTTLPTYAECRAYFEQRQTEKAHG